MLRIYSVSKRITALPQRIYAPNVNSVRKSPLVFSRGLQSKTKFSYRQPVEDDEEESSIHTSVSKNRIVPEGSKVWGGNSSVGTDLCDRVSSKQYALYRSITLLEGETLCVWNSNGKSKLVNGPTQVRIINQYYQFLPTFTAYNNEYLEVRHKNGKVDIIPGPNSIQYDPASHKSVIKRKTLRVDAGEMIVVYRQGSQRDIIKGPQQYYPSTPAEWVHQFNWAADEDAGDYKFHRLRIVPDLLQIEMSSVSLADGSEISMDIDLHFQFIDPILMLDTCRSPLIDLSHFITADTCNFCGKMNFTEFKAENEKLNDTRNYPLLIKHAAEIGVKINKIILKEYKASGNLAKLTALKQDIAFKEATQASENKIRDVKLAQEMKEDTTRHTQNLRKISDLQENELNHLQKLAGHKVDLTAYLVSKNRSADQIISLQQPLPKST